MNTRALQNPYQDYDGNPALTQTLFDCHGKVKYAYEQVKCARACDSRMVTFVIKIFLPPQLTSEFAQRLSSKINELLAVMENGLKSADPRDCTSYTGWAGDDTITHPI